MNNNCKHKFIVIPIMVTLPLKTIKEKLVNNIVCIYCDQSIISDGDKFDLFVRNNCYFDNELNEWVLK